VVAPQRERSEKRQSIAMDDDRPLDALRGACGDRHELWLSEAPVSEYADSGLPATTMGRSLSEDRLFFAAALAAGGALAEAAPARIALLEDEEEEVW
jgi:hypothetical protein